VVAIRPPPSLYGGRWKSKGTLVNLPLYWRSMVILALFFNFVILPSLSGLKLPLTPGLDVR
jgi:hypothetical protein